MDRELHIMDDYIKYLYCTLCSPRKSPYGPWCAENEKICKKIYTAEIDYDHPTLNDMGYVFVKVHRQELFTRNVTLFPEWVW